MNELDTNDGGSDIDDDGFVSITITNSSVQDTLEIKTTHPDGLTQIYKLPTGSTMIHSMGPEIKIVAQMVRDVG